MDKIKVLVVDDEVDYLTLMKEYIEYWGYQVITAQSGKEALAAIKAESPDITILDYLMPEMDGVTVLKEIRKFDQDLEVIMFTAHPDIKNIKGAKELGVTFFVPKLNDDALNIQGSLRAALDMAQKKISKNKSKN
jgi:two-component system, response regulator, stage 0 sporulation protein F